MKFQRKFFTYILFLIILIFSFTTNHTLANNLAMDGCTDDEACNYDPSATVDDGSCVYEDDCYLYMQEPCVVGGYYFWDADNCFCEFLGDVYYGCTDVFACNFDQNAECDDGSCISGAGNPNSCNDDCTMGDIEIWNAVICECEVVEIVVQGCTDPTSPNFNPNANCDNGTCSTQSNLQIVSITPTACPPDPENPTTCLNVCPFNSQVYVVDGYSGEVEWEVIGSESYEVIGNELLVNWGEPGSGLITASSEGEVDGDCNIQVTYEPEGCQGVFVNGDSSFEYIWTDFFGNIVATGQSFIAQQSGDYSLTVFDPSTDCLFTDSLSLPLANDDFFVEAVTSTTSCNSPNGSIISTVQGGSPPYSYQWSNGATTQIINGLAEGFYQLTVYDSFGCTAEGDFAIDCGSDCDSEVVTTFINPDCSSGGIIVVVMPPNFATYISGPNGYTSSSTSNENLEPGTYLIITGETGIQETVCHDIIVLENPLADLAANVINASDCDTCDGQINFSNFSNIFFDWSNGNQLPFNQNLCAGTYSVTATDFNGGTCVYNYTVGCGESIAFEISQCIDVIEETEAIISTTPETTNGEVNICAGQTIYFESQSINAETHVWDFGNGENDSGITTEFTYDVPGSYLVELIARNECFCADTTTINVNVDQAIIPEIDCIGTICEDTEVTYTTDADCSSYNWTISGDATIVEGGGASDDFITINWGAGPIGTISLGVNNCTENYCISENLSQIPIIGSNDNIKGKTNVCKGELQVYTITEYGGTDFTWDVSQFGEIVDGQGTATVSVQWTDLLVPASPQWVSVEYENCYLECGGGDILQVNILDEFFFSGPIELCLEETGTYTAESLTGGSALLNWELSAANGVVLLNGGPSAQFDVSLPGPPGNYTLLATPASAASFCSNSYSAFISLLDNPPAVLSINGETEICVGETYTYSALTSEDNTSFAWEINDGGNITTAGGGILNVTWNSQGPYSLSVLQIANSETACESESVTMNLTKIDDIVISGQQEHCIETTSSFVATAYSDVNYNWVVTPENAATIVEGQGTNSIDVFWHSVGNATVQLDACANSDNFNVFVNPRPVPLVNHAIALCPEAMSGATTTIPYSNYIWRDTNGVTISTSSNPGLGPGNYELIVQDENGCEGNVIFEIETLPSPIAEISSPNLLTYCPPGFPVPTLYALESDPPYTYQWYRNNVLIPGATMSLYTPPSGESGNYYVQVVNEYGCTENSNILVVEYGCAGGGGTPPPPELSCQNVPLSFEISNTNFCQQHKFVNTSANHIPGTTDWYFGYPDIEGTATGENVTYDFQQAGFYFVVMISDHLVNGVVERCGLGKLDIVPVSPDFHVLSNCVDSAIEFEDLSAFVTGQSVTSWTWDFGDPASGSNNTSTLQDPTHAYSTAGVYNVTLIITGPNGCTSEIIKSIEIQDPPAPTFDLPIADCQGIPLDFTANVGSNVTDVFWDFGDPTSGDANTSEVIETYHEYENPGTYTITLTAQTIYGCEGIFTQQVTVEQNTLSGMIVMNPGSPICQNQTTTLRAPGEPSLFSFDWSTGEVVANIITGEAGVYNVTVSDDNGCTYSPPEVVLDVLPLPGGEIRVVEYNEFDQPVDFFFDTYTICEGDEVYMEVNEVDGYEYTWNDGNSSTELEFTIERDNLLEEGTHVFDVTIVDTETGCSNIVGPFTVFVNANPDDILLVSNPDGMVCDNQPVTISISNYDPNLTYVWNTGTIDATAIIVDVPGIYFVRGFNDNGCETTSNEIEINKGPDVNRIPSGCHRRCSPDSLCLPSMPGIVSWQWYFEDTPIPAPEGNQVELVATESGDYYVIMLDESGCEATSGIMTLDLFIGTGTIGGEVWFDVNNNGIIDGPDTLMSNQTIFIEGENFSDQVVTNSVGGYTFEDILAVNYDLYFDSLSLPVGWVVQQSTQQSALLGCDNINEVNWLVSEVCQIQSSEVFFNLCPGETMMYNGVELNATSNVEVLLNTAGGCDSIVTVTVTPFETSSDTILASACAEEFFEYNGFQILAGETFLLEMTNINGCDSNEMIVVEPLNPTGSLVQLEACEGGSIIYEGVEIASGSSEEFVFVNSIGCDSIVIVDVNPIEILPEIILASACFEEFFDYNGVAILAGDTLLIEMFDINGCDSNEVVIVEALNPTGLLLEFEVCEGEMIIYEDTEIEAGGSEEFVFINSIGCDSIVTVVGVPIPLSFDVIELFVCIGDSIVYNNQVLYPNSTQEIIFESFNGCDSVEQVTVLEMGEQPMLLEVEICPEESFLYNGESYTMGTNELFTYVSSTGCDSIVNLTVVATPEFSFDYEAETICVNDVGAITIVNMQGSTDPYLFSMNGENFQTQNTFENINPGEHLLYVQDINGCVNSMLANIPVHEEMNILAANTTLSCDVDSVQLEVELISGANIDLEFIWPDGTSGNDFFAYSTGSYEVQVSNVCEDKTIEIIVNSPVDDPSNYIYVPNVFSPNGDGINDEFIISPAEHVTINNYEIHIFDRWGEEEYYGTDITKGWDGKLKDGYFNPGVHVWWIRMDVDFCGETRDGIFEKGDVTVIR